MPFPPFHFSWQAGYANKALKNSTHYRLTALESNHLHNVLHSSVVNIKGWRQKVDRIQVIKIALNFAQIGFSASNFFYKMFGQFFHTG